MSRPMKDGKILNVKIESDVYELLDEYSKLNGVSKTWLVERALMVYMKLRIRNVWDSLDDDERNDPAYNMLRTFREALG